MEAASQFQTVAKKMAKLAEQYPLDKYVWIMPKLGTAGALPEHLDFMVSTRKFTLEGNDVYPINAKSIEKAKEVGLSKSSLMALAADAGIKWIPNLNRRLDDGTDPDIVEWQATGVLAGLSGMTPVTATKRVDLDHLRERDEWNLRKRPPLGIVLPGVKWTLQENRYEQTPWGELTTEQRENYINNKVRENNMQRKEFKLEMAETKAQLRVIRAILGIPSKFDKATIKNKEFAVLTVIFAPKAQTPEERKLILERTMDTYMPAFPGIQPPAQVGAGEAPVQISPHDVHTALPEASAQPVGGVPLVAPSADIPYAEEIDDNGDPPPEKTTTDNFKFLEALAEIKRGFVELLGTEGGELEYYAPIHVLGFQKSNQIVDEEQQKAIYRKLRDRLALLTQNAGQVKKRPEGIEEKDEGDDIWIYRPIRAALGEFAKEALEKSLTGYYNDYAYPINSDPKGIKAMLEKRRATKGALVDAHVLILKWNKEQGGK